MTDASAPPTREEVARVIDDLETYEAFPGDLLEARNLIARREDQIVELTAANGQLQGRLGAMENALAATSQSLARAEADIARLERERDGAREHGMKARLREIAAEDARISAVSRATRAEAALAAAKAEGMREAIKIYQSAADWDYFGAAEAAILAAIPEGK